MQRPAFCLIDKGVNTLCVFRLTKSKLDAHLKRERRQNWHDK